MPDKTAGQWAGTIIGAVVGYVASGFNPMGAMYGASLGAGIGGLVDPPKGPVVDGPRLQDLSVQSFQFGAPLARDYGTVGHMGTIIWVENNSLSEVVRKEEQGGKGGGGGATTRTYTYFATFAVALCDAPEGGIVGVTRIWAGPNLIYSSESDDIDTIIASNIAAEGFRVYTGTDYQLPDPRIEAEMGIGNAPAFRGTAYIVFYDMELTKYGNTLMGAQIKAEVVVSDAENQYFLTGEVESHFPFLDSPSYSGCASLGLDGTTSYIAARDADGDIYEERIFGGEASTFALIHRVQEGEVPRRPLDGDIDVRGSILISETTVTIGSDGSYSPGFITDTASLDMVFKKADTRIGLKFTGAETYLYRIVTGPEISEVYSGCFVWALSQNGELLCGIEEDSLTIVVLNAIDFSFIDSFELASPYSLSADMRDFRLTCAYISGDNFYVFNNTVLLLLCVSISGRSEIFRRPVPPLANNAPTTASTARIAINGNMIYRYRYGSTASPTVIGYYKLAPPDSIYPLSTIVEREIFRSGLVDMSDLDMSDLSSDQVRGFTIAGVKQVRSILSPLQVAWPFDLIPSGYMIRAVRRGNSSIIDIPVEHLDARDYGSEYSIQFAHDREMDSQLPRQVVVRNLDADREYDTNEQRSIERQSSGARNIQEVELALVLTANESAQIADVIHSVAWMQKGGPFRFKLPHDYLYLEPADVITIVAPYGSFELILIEISYSASGVLDCSAALNSAESYVSNAVGSIGVVPPGTIPLSGDSTLVLMDIPLIRNEDNTPAFGSAMVGESQSWPGGAAYRSTDNEQTWSLIQAWNSPVTMGVGRNFLPDHTALVIDRTNSLHVDLSDGSLSSISEPQMMTGRHWCAYGVDGRWEIIRFASADLQPDGSYVLNTILRGLRGSEINTGNHSEGDYFVLLEDPDVVRIGSDIATLNVVRQWRGLTVGQPIDAVESINFAYRGVNLMPLAPANLRGSLSGGTWVIEWSPRTRLQGSLWKTGIALPVGEEVEFYRIQIMDGDVVVRNMTSNTSTIDYTLEQQIEDFGVGVSVVEVIVRQISAIVGAGYPASAVLVTDVITPALLLHFDGTNGSTTFIDSSPFSQPATVIGNAQISTAQSRFSGASGLFDGSGDAVTFPHSDRYSAQTDFTIEAFFNTYSSSPNSGACFKKNPISTRNSGIELSRNGSGFNLYVSNGTTTFSVSCGIAFPASTWVHIAAVKYGNQIMIFRDGVLMNTTALTGSMVDNTSPVYVGGRQDSAASWQGNIDEMRFVSGIAVYTTNFTPPSAPFAS